MDWSHYAELALVALRICSEISPAVEITLQYFAELYRFFSVIGAELDHESFQSLRQKIIDQDLVKIDHPCLDEQHKVLDHVEGIVALLHVFGNSNNRT